MKNLFKHWDNAKEELSDKYIMLFLDYDGTLTPIVQTPDKVVLSSGTKRLLEKLIRNPRYKIAIISGRGLKNLKKRVGITGIIYVGNHGLEIEGPKIKFGISIPSGYKRILQHIKNELNAKLSDIEGVFVEDKGLSLSVHYRLAGRHQMQKVKTILHKVTSQYTARDKIRIKTGKKVFEVRPAVEWDKGKAVLWLLAKQRIIWGNNRILPIYIGDDVTDEDAFKALKNKGIGVFVGKSNKSSYAKYYLRDTEEVKDFLIRMKTLFETRVKHARTN